MEAFKKDIRKKVDELIKMGFSIDEVFHLIDGHVDTGRISTSISYWWYRYTVKHLPKNQDQRSEIK